MKTRQKYLTEAEDTTTPEHYLWTSVLSKAAHDAIYGSDWREAKSAIAWFKEMGKGFKEVCELAGRDPSSVHRKMQSPIEKRETHMEWFVERDVIMLKTLNHYQHNTIVITEDVLNL